MQATGQNPEGFASGAVGDGRTENSGPSVDHPDAEIIVPEAGESDELFADVTATGDGSTEDPTRGQGQTSGGRSTVAVRDVVSDYRSQAVDSLDSLDLAPSETDAVRSYFDRLAETTGADQN
jgi:hypothetical protein